MIFITSLFHLQSYNDRANDIKSINILLAEYTQNTVCQWWILYFAYVIYAFIRGGAEDQDDVLKISWALTALQKGVKYVNVYLNFMLLLFRLVGLHLGDLVTCKVAKGKFKI